MDQGTIAPLAAGIDPEATGTAAALRA